MGHQSRWDSEGASGVATCCLGSRHQRQSEAIRGHQWPSEAIDETHLLSRVEASS